MEREDKLKIVEEARKKFEKSQAVFVVTYSGVDVQGLEQIRKSLRNAQGELKVVKNTLMRLALSHAHIAYDDELLKGQNAFVFSYTDPVQVAKAIVEFSKKFPQFEAKGGWLDDKPIQAEGIKRLAELPGRDELLAQLVGRCKAPVAGLVFVLQGVLRSLVIVLQAIEEKKK